MSFAAGDPPYQASKSPARQFQPGLVFMCTIMAGSFFLWAAAGFQIVFIVPRFVKIFDEFRMALPLSTQLVIDYGMWIVLAVMLTTFLFCAFFRSRWIWITLLLVIPVFVNISIFANLYYPQMKLLEGLAK